MSLHCITKRADLQRISPPCMVMAYAILSLLPISAAAQVADDPSERVPGLQDLELSRPDEPTIRYAISIPRTYSALTPAPSHSCIALRGSRQRRCGRRCKCDAEPHWSGTRRTRRRHRRAGFGARKLGAASKTRRQ